MTDITKDQLDAVTKRVVDKYTFEGLLFTSLDVSNSVKQVLSSVRHREISPIVRGLFETDLMGDTYTRTLIDVMAGGSRGKPAEAYLYHLTTSDPGEYDDDRRRQLAIPPVSASALDDEVIDPNATELTLEVGMDGRARLPRKFVEEAGINTEKVRVESRDGGCKLWLTAHLPGDPVAGHTVVEYAHPSYLHISATLLDGMEATKPIVAKLVVEEGAISIEGSPKLN